MEIAAERMRLGAWVFVSIAMGAGASGASVVLPPSRIAGLQAVADRVHALAVQVRARAFVADQTDGELRVHEAVSMASGVLVGNGLVLTALSAVTLQGPDGGLQPANEVEVVVDDVGTLPARLLAGDAGLGVAVVQLPDLARGLAAASLAADDPKPGDELLAVGVDGDSIRAVGVLLEKIVLDDAGPRLETDRAPPPSFWGGPLFDERGHLVGIAVRETRAGGTGVPVSLLRPLLGRLLAGSRT
jgi:S1-C subfamily serine protease